MRQQPVASERGCPVCGQRIDVVAGLFVRHRVRPESEEPFADECWGSCKTADWRSSPAPRAGSETEGVRSVDTPAETTGCQSPSVAGVGLFQVEERDGIKVLIPLAEGGQ